MVFLDIPIVLISSLAAQRNGKVIGFWHSIFIFLGYGMLVLLAVLLPYLLRFFDGVGRGKATGGFGLFLGALGFMEGVLSSLLDKRIGSSFVNRTTIQKVQ